MGVQFLYHIRDGKFELELECVHLFFLNDIEMLVGYDTYFAIENNWGELDLILYR